MRYGGGRPRQSESGGPAELVQRFWDLRSGAVDRLRCGDIDLDDYAAFTECMRGPNLAPDPVPPPTVAECIEAFDFDVDADVDLADFAGFQQSAT